nr:acyl carrier protein 1, chloroplastic-like [Tanacetum cinerariifolium]
MRLIHNKQLEDVPELVHYVQSLLPADVAPRTCLVSKSWLHAFSTTTALRFHRSVKSLSKQQERKYARLINRTLRRYHRDNLPFITFDLHYGIRKQKSAARAEKWIKRVASKSSLKMKEAKRMRLIHNKQLEDVPELVQYVQSLLPADVATRTCLVSKSWLHAFSTTTALRFHRSVKSLSKQQERKYTRLINRTLRRYHRDNLPFITFDLHYGIRKQKSAARAEKWIKRVASKSSLKVLCITIFDDIGSFTFPDEIFSSENLNTLNLKLDVSNDHSLKTNSLRNYSHHISRNPVIECVNLLVLELLDVHISEVVLHNLLSTCKLLEKINLRFPAGLEKIKVHNLRYLHELKIAPNYHNDILEISDVPRLRSLLYDALTMWIRPVSFKMDLLGSLRDLCLNYVDMDDAFSNMIKSNYGKKNKLRETLDLSSKFNIEIKFNIDIRRFGSGVLLPFNIDDVRTGVQYPATNVEKLTLGMLANEGLWENSLLFDAVFDAVFSICHPIFTMAAVPVACVRLTASMHTNQIVGRTSTLKLVPVGRTNSRFPVLRTYRFQISCSAKPETVNRVCEIVKTQLALADGSVVAPDSKFSALGADSLDTVEIVMTLEEEFGISVEEENSQNITTVQEAADLIEKLVEKKNATA